MKQGQDIPIQEDSSLQCISKTILSGKKQIFGKDNHNAGPNAEEGKKIWQ